MPSSLLKRLSWLWPIVAALLGIVLLLADPLPLQTLRNAMFDQYQRWHPRPYQAVPVRIIDIDEASLNRLGQWPWPRTRMAELVDKLQQAEVAAIGFDVVFAEPDRTSPQTVSQLWSLPDDWQHKLQQLPDHDQQFAASMAKAPVVLGFALERTATATAKQPARPFRYIHAGESPDRWFHPFAAAVTSLPQFEQVAQGNGALSFVPDNDGVVRRVPLVLSAAGQPVSTLVTETLRVGQGAKNLVLKAADEADTGLAEIRISDFTVPTTAHGEMWVHYSEPVAGRYLPAWQVLAGQVPAELLQGHLVLIGASAQGLMDLRFSPLGRIMPGVEAHAQALEQILTEHYLQRPSWAKAAEVVTLLLVTLSIGFVSLRLGAMIAALVTAVLLALVLGGGWFAFRDQQLLLNSLTPAIVGLSTFILGSLIHHWLSEREQRWIKEAFSRYVSPNRVTYLVDHPDAMALGGRRQQCSFIFTDLAGFTSLMESIDPSEAVALLNAYLDEMIGIAFRYEGTLDRIVGDAVAIMFSAPVPQADHQARALACALEMHAFASRYAADLQAQGIQFGKTRIGVHCGEVIVGNFGGSTIFDYRALGDAVNTAARLESVNKHLGTTVCVSEAILSACIEPVPARPVGKLVLKGKQQALQVFEPVAAARPEQDAPLAEYQAFYQQLQASTDDDDCLPTLRAQIASLATRYPTDPLIQLHHQRLAQGKRGDILVMQSK